jgi:hypothetical protein
MTKLLFFAYLEDIWIIFYTAMSDL